jgi:thiamine-phosphate pyrophosphorylase
MRSFRRLEGLYLVVSSILPLDELLLATEKALRGGVDILQLIAGPETSEMLAFARGLLDLTRKHKTPLLVNGSLRLVKEIDADGVHFDNYETTPSQVKQTLGRKCIVGYTLSNDTQRLRWAEEAGADYVSFCSVFPTCTANQCQIVPLETIRTARSRTSLPIFAAGGINLENAHLVLEAGVDGIAVTSALLKAKDPKQTAISLKKIIRNYRRNIS